MFLERDNIFIVPNANMNSLFVHEGKDTLVDRNLAREQENTVTHNQVESNLIAVQHTERHENHLQGNQLPVVVVYFVGVRGQVEIFDEQRLLHSRCENTLIEVSKNSPTLGLVGRTLNNGNGVVQDHLK